VAAGTASTIGFGLQSEAYAEVGLGEVHFTAEGIGYESLFGSKKTEFEGVSRAAFYS